MVLSGGGDLAGPAGNKTYYYNRRKSEIPAVEKDSKARTGSGLQGATVRRGEFRDKDHGIGKFRTAFYVPLDEPPPQVAVPGDFR